MIPNAELVSRFFDGEYEGVSNSMSIGETEAGGHFIMGYGHAVYAYRPPDDRFGPVVFSGWKGASHATTGHIGLMEDRADVTFDGRPSESDVAHDPDLDVLASISSNDKSYGSNQRSFRSGGDA